MLILWLLNENGVAVQGQHAVEAIKLDMAGTTSH